MTQDHELPFDSAELRSRLAGQSGPTLWRSLEDLADSPEARRFMEAEFPDLAAPGQVDRRTLLRLMAASLALGGVAACGQGNEKLLSPPQGLAEPAGDYPGHMRERAVFFASTVELNGFGRGVIVETHDGRATRIEGNPLHPASVGSSDVWMQAEVLSLYDPDRSRAPRENGAARDWDAVRRFLVPERERLIAARGQGLRILSEPITSPTMWRLTERLGQALPEAVMHQYSPVLDDYPRLGAIMAFGRPADTVFDLRQADVVLCLGGNLFLEAPGHIRYAADYAERKREGLGNANRPLLYVAETTPSITGASAHERIILAPQDFESFARAVLAALQGAPMPDSHPAAAVVAAELRRAGPGGLVTVGREHPPVVHAIAHAINAALGAPGRTVRYIAPVSPSSVGQMESLVELARAIAAGEVSHLLILGGNPVYDAPADLDFEALIRSVPVSAHLSTTVDETSLACRWHLPRLHPLESWGDLRAFDGTVGLRQPTTEPQFEALTAEGMVAALIPGETLDGRELVRATWRNHWTGDFEEQWLLALEAGIVPDTAFPPLDLRLTEDWNTAAPVDAEPARGGITVTFSPDPSVWDGRFTNNSWLQELPRPLSKIVWNNAAYMAPATAEALGFKTGDIAELRIGELVLRAPIWTLPGQAPDTVTLPLGYGRIAAGQVGNLIGFNAYALRPSREPWTLPGVEIAHTGERHDLISTQHLHWIEGREIIRVAQAPDLEVENPGAGDLPSFYPEYPYPTYAWAMAIDLDTCIGCNACVIACQSENNIPIVGPEEVSRGRIMHWLRVDRYYGGDRDDPETYFQPVPCMHCEKAPCEVVCPVNATVHSSEGINEMVYNRCIGTRTCSNNCPYKVRRFNWFDYSGGPLNSILAAPNPEVTIRDRGVMEKCTYCIQRISAERIEARLEERPIRDGDVATACQEACPTRAIVFGDMNDPTTLVSKLRANPRNYALLGELNTQPRTTYLAVVEDRGAASPDAPKLGG
jgi:MoCo/4Fe-4S cofactor protein with predicted Tat translocation signal